MDYLKVALRGDLAAEDTSQAAQRAIVHLIGPLSHRTFCGKERVADLAHAGTDRIVSCADCLSFSRSMRETPADHTSLTDGAYRVLRNVSTPDYTGLERRSRPRFIEADLTIDQLTNGETMKQYTNVIRDDVGSVHALYLGETATACGAVNASDTTASDRAVSCDACMKAIIGQQRASDHRTPSNYDWRTLNDAQINEITQFTLGQWPSFEAQSWACKVVHAVLDRLRILPHEMIADAGDKAMRIVNDADLLEQLRQVCGYVENGSSEYVTIGQDDATREWTVSIGDSHARATGKARRYHGTSFHQAIRAAAAKEIEAEEPQATGYADQDAAPAAVSRDAVVEANRKLLLDRSNVGIEKYGVTLEKSGLTQRQFIQHALEETLDLANYLQATLMTTPDQQQ